jgi:hypothetical protein
MRSTLSITSTALVLLVLSRASDAQVSRGGIPQGRLQPFAAAAPMRAVAAPDVARLMAEDEARNHRPMRYGALIPLDADVEDGAWTTLADGRRTWRLLVAAPGARTLAVDFATFDLPAGAEMFVYGTQVDTVLGAYTGLNQHADGGFVFQPFPGDELVLEVTVPAGAADPVLVTRALIWDYRGVLDYVSTASGGSVGGSGSGTGCLIDVNCPEGAGLDPQKRATVRTFSGGGLCSGALINDAQGSQAGFVLTADHCQQGTSTVFMFRNERPGCDSGTAPIDMTVSGCTVIASSSSVDSRLLRITSPIPIAYQPYYAGWNRTASNATFAYAMGHPGGGPKKISIDANGTTSSTTDWVVFWNQGVLEGGSSGGPLFDQDGRVKGPACCVVSFTCGQQTAFFGQFRQFWNVAGVSAALDPLGANPTIVNGLDPLILPAVPFCFGDGTGTACPCGNSSVVGNQEGCLNGFGIGGKLVATGAASVGNDTFELHGSRMPNGPALYYQGTIQTGGGAGAVFGDGKRCASGTVIRFDTQFNVGGASQYPGLTDLAISVKGMDVAGSSRTYQCWYRDAQTFCTTFTYNLTNGVAVTWGP